jgi:predicted phage tail protein
MAVLTPSVYSALVYTSGAADRVALYGLRNVTAGDTLDVGPSGAGQFQTVTRAVVIGIDVFVEIAAANTGTVITIPAGMSQSMGYLLIWGSSN